MPQLVATDARAARLADDQRHPKPRHEAKALLPRVGQVGREVGRRELLWRKLRPRKERRTKRVWREHELATVGQHDGVRYRAMQVLAPLPRVRPALHQDQPPLAGRQHLAAEAAGGRCPISRRVGVTP